MEAILCFIYLPLVFSSERDSYKLKVQGIYSIYLYYALSVAHPVTSDGLFVGAALSGIAG